MEPIINPWLIYFASSTDSFKIAIALGLFVCVITIFGWIMFYMTDCIKNKCPKWLYILTIVLTMLLAVVPSKETVLSMMVVNQITPNNIEIAGNTIESAIDYIFEKIDEITEEDKD